MNKLYQIYSDSLRPIKFLSIPLMLISASGLFANDGLKSLILMLQIAPGWFWGSILVILAICRGIALFTDRMPKIGDVLVPVACIWMWSIVICSSIMRIPPVMTGFLYIIPILMELWVLARHIDFLMDKPVDK